MVVVCMIVIKNISESILFTPFSSNAIQCNVHNIAFTLDLSEENPVCFEFTVSSDNEVTRWTENYKRLICCFFFYDASRCDFFRS